MADPEFGKLPYSLVVSGQLAAIKKRSDALVFLSIIGHACSDGYTSKPGINTIIRETGLSERTVQRSVSCLIEVGLITCPNGRRGGKNQSTFYQIQSPNPVTHTDGVSSPKGVTHVDGVSEAKGVTHVDGVSEAKGVTHVDGVTTCQQSHTPSIQTPYPVNLSPNPVTHVDTRREEREEEMHKCMHASSALVEVGVSASVANGIADRLVRVGGDDKAAARWIRSINLTAADNPAAVLVHEIRSTNDHLLAKAIAENQPVDVSSLNFDDDNPLKHPSGKISRIAAPPGKYDQYN